jgi:hypothetical protein
MGQNDEKEYRYPAIRKYDDQDFERFKRSEGKEQHNIMMLVGNGFDISVLNYLGSKNSTDYKSFFYYLKSIKFNDDNVLFRKMDELRITDEQAQDERDRVPNWSDFESILEKFIFSPDPEDLLLKGRLKDDLREIQYEFSHFLNFVVSPDLLSELDKKSSESKWGYRTYASFIADLDKEDYKKFNFLRKFDFSNGRAHHYHVFNFNIINFNYTALLDNYIHLDKDQFDPRPHGSVDTNFQFRFNPRDYENYDSRSYPNAETGCSAYLTTEIHHPHGLQQIPRSLLFGIDGDGRKYSNKIEPFLFNFANMFYVPQFEKVFWAQTSLRYEKAISETELFIIFGSSRGETDRWWWSHILSAIFHRDAELIIYQRLSSDCDQSEVKRAIKKEFIENNFDRKLFKNEHAEVFEKIYSRISIVLYRDSLTISAFGFCEKSFNPEDRDPGNVIELQ